MTLLASRALVGVAARSLAGVEEQVTLVQYRALVLLDAGPQNVGTLAKALGIHPSTATRLCDRLTTKGLVKTWDILRTTGEKSAFCSAERDDDSFTP